MAPVDGKPTLNLTIYLAKLVYDTPASLLKDDEKDLSVFPIPLTVSVMGDLYVQTLTPRAPRWARYFREYIDIRIWERLVRPLRC